MPGPRNSKKKRKQQAEKEKAKRMKNLLQEVLNTRQFEDELDTTRALLEQEPPSQTADADHELRPSTSSHSHISIDSESTQTPPVSAAEQRPFIHNPGNGPRVLNMPSYLSSFFVPPPALDDPLCAALAYRAYDVLAMLENALGLPYEVALIVWFNKTRKLGRVCPACQRVYRLGDTLSDPITNQPLDPRDASTPSWVLREQYISGLCSAPCFTLASYTTHPYVANVVRGAWGRIAEEIDDETAAMLAAPRTSEDDQGLGTVLRVTRLVDLGMGPLLGLSECGELKGDGDQDSSTGREGSAGADVENRSHDSPEKVSSWDSTQASRGLVC